MIRRLRVFRHFTLMAIYYIPIVNLKPWSCCSCHEIAPIRRPFTSHRPFSLSGSKLFLINVIPEYLAHKHEKHIKSVSGSKFSHMKFIWFQVLTYEVHTRSMCLQSCVHLSMRHTKYSRYLQFLFYFNLLF